MIFFPGKVKQNGYVRSCDLNITEVIVIHSHSNQWYEAEV